MKSNSSSSSKKYTYAALAGGAIVLAAAAYYLTRSPSEPEQTSTESFSDSKQVKGDPNEKEEEVQRKIEEV